MKKSAVKATASGCGACLTLPQTFVMKFFSACLLLPLLSLAHPGIGIVKDSKGAIYYTDLEQVWKLDKSGNKTVVVPHVHTHELYMDENDNLYGEHLWYNGERLNTWGHYVWRLQGNGVLDTVVRPTEGFLQNYSFVRDGRGNMYWVERGDTSRFKKRTPEGNVATVAEGRFENIRWSHCTQEGILYFVDLHKLYKLSSEGKFTLLASDLDGGKTGFGFDRQHNVYGIWTDKANNVYVAIQAGRNVKRISPQGKVDVVAYSLAPWSPVSGLFDDEGGLWLLESSVTNKVRVRTISAQQLAAGPDKTKAVLINNVLPYAVAAVVVGLIATGLIKVFKNRRRRNVTV